MFSNWIKKFKTENTNEATHLLMNGGKIKIEDEMEFLKNYSKTLHTNEKTYIVERRPEVFKYHIDLDIEDNEYWSKDNLIELTKVIQEVIYSFYCIDQNVICCIAPKKIKESKIKTGVHLIWPKHFIRVEDCLILRLALIIKLYENFPNLNWDNIFDECVYTRNGFRMVGSDKLDPNTRLPENREYNLYFIMDSKGELRTLYYNRLNTNPYSLILDTSIRYTYLEGSKLTIDFKKIPEWFEIPKEQLQKKLNKTKTKKITLGINNDKISNLIRKALPKCYKGIMIKNIEKYSDGNYLVVPNSRYCMNIRRDHKSCGIYFFISKKGIYQKCLCPCDTLAGRINGYCKNYVSKCYEYDSELGEYLFPNEELLNSKNSENNESKHINVTKKGLSRKMYINNCTKFCDQLVESLI